MDTHLEVVLEDTLLLDLSLDLQLSLEIALIVSTPMYMAVSADCPRRVVLPTYTAAPAIIPCIIIVIGDSAMFYAPVRICVYSGKQMQVHR